MLGVASDSSDEHLYACAVHRWGAGADRQMSGHYASITLHRDGTLRLARSPWGGPSLFFAHHGNATMVCSIPRPIFAAGLPRRLKPGQLNRLANRIEPGPGEDHWYDGLRRVPQGTIVTLDGKSGGEHHDAWYDPHAIPPLRLPDDAAYERRARELLRTSVSGALSRARKPAMLLSGGLDSALAAAEVMDQLPTGARLPSYTTIPVAEWDGWCLPGWFGDEEAKVRAFAAQHPALDPQFVRPPEDGFTANLDALLVATDAVRLSHVPSTVYHAPFAAAARDGCDTVFTATLGNATFSNEGRWALAEFARRGQWGKMMRILRHQPGDTRPLWRRVLAHGILPNLPRPVRRAVRRLVHGSDATAANPDALLRDGPAASDIAGRERGERPRARRDWVEEFWNACDQGCEVAYGFEQVFGIRQEDLMQDRALIEFSIAMPTDQLVRGDTQRFLARRLARGIMPEEQRLDRRAGLHNADWHARMSATLPALKADIEAAAHDPELAQTYDIDRARSLLANWPGTPPENYDEAATLYHGLTGLAVASRFARFAKGSNR